MAHISPVTMQSEAARDAVSDWEAGDIVFCLDEASLAVFDGDAWASAGGGGTQTATVALSNAQMLALGDTAVEIVPAPAAGKAIYPFGGVFEYIAGSTAFDDTMFIQIGYGDVAALLSASFGTVTIVAGTTSTLAPIVIGQNGSPLLSEADGAALMAGASLASEAGDGSGLLIVAYIVVDLA